MDGHSGAGAGAGPVRSRSSQSSQSPSHSASASASSSVRQKRKFQATVSAAAPSVAVGPFSHPDSAAAAAAAAALVPNDDLDNISAKEEEEEEEYDEEEEDDDEEEEEDHDSMRTFTAARLDAHGSSGAGGGGGNPRSTKPPKLDNPSARAEPFGGGGTEGGGKDDRGAGGLGASAAGNAGGASGAAAKEEASKGIFTENIQTSGAYSAREEGLKREEDSGKLRFLCYANDGIDERMIWLIGLKNIFARQLPNMPKEYIVRLVLDRSHKSMMVIRNNQVVGGITYRPYASQRFGEIAFCAITSDEQVKGYGTRLMNHLKQHARDVDGLTHFLTYADNNAVGYFIKQGFTKEITFDKERWQGYIKDYDGGILMECKIDPKLPYTDLSTMIRRQRQEKIYLCTKRCMNIVKSNCLASGLPTSTVRLPNKESGHLLPCLPMAIDEKIRELSNCHIIYSGIDFQKKEAGIPRQPIKAEDIPGLREAGWTPDQWGHSRFKSASASIDSTAYRQSLNSLMRQLLKIMNEHTDAWPFKEPVDARAVPDYYDIIKDPVDLKTMSKRVDSEQYYVTLEMFAADVKRMFANARTYNAPETIYYKLATRLEAHFTAKFHSEFPNYVGKFNHNIRNTPMS